MYSLELFRNVSSIIFLLYSISIVKMYSYKNEKEVKSTINQKLHDFWHGRQTFAGEQWQNWDTNSYFLKWSSLRYVVSWFWFILFINSSEQETCFLFQYASSIAFIYFLEISLSLPQLLIRPAPCVSWVIYCHAAVQLRKMAKSPSTLLKKKQLSSFDND